MNNFSTLITGIQHIGIPTKDVSATITFYESLGFKVTWLAESKDVAFLELGSCVIETYFSEALALKNGAIDHIALNVSDVEKVYNKIMESDYTLLDNGINFLPFFKNGVRFFAIQGPNMEKIEFNQILQEKTP